MTLFVTLFVVLSDNDVISPSLKGLALSYTIQVRHTGLVVHHTSASQPLRTRLCSHTCALTVHVAAVSS